MIELKNKYICDFWEHDLIVDCGSLSSPTITFSNDENTIRIVNYEYSPLNIIESKTIESKSNRLNTICKASKRILKKLNNDHVHFLDPNGFKQNHGKTFKQICQTNSVGPTHPTHTPTHTPTPPTHTHLRHEQSRYNCSTYQSYPTKSSTIKNSNEFRNYSRSFDSTNRSFIPTNRKTIKSPNNKYHSIYS
jgi:hypothetical protein